MWGLVSEHIVLPAGAVVLRELPRKQHAAEHRRRWVWCATGGADFGSNTVADFGSNTVVLAIANSGANSGVASDATAAVAAVDADVGMP